MPENQKKKKVLTCWCFLSAVVSKPSDCIFPYDFKEAVRKKVSSDALLGLLPVKSRAVPDWFLAPSSLRTGKWKSPRRSELCSASS